ncbi:MAG TPA: polymer-forming cytoskeletal protein [Burkholderiaceae bacterium]|jgi:cytoskeletal protein CcmA (bactofilin family)|nr:polymer-forming cytoskeletal protein [Burkholderiaceae bacterium]
MFNQKKPPPIKSLIAQGSRIDGNYHFTEGLRVDGELVGDIQAPADAPSILMISESASVTGAVRAHHVIVNGSVTGPVTATELLELQPKARIIGDVTYKALEMHQGAVIQGVLKPLMGGVEGAEKPALTLAASNQ